MSTVTPTKRKSAKKSKQPFTPIPPTPNLVDLPSLGMYTSSPIDSPLTNRKRRRNQFSDLASSPLRGRVNYYQAADVDHDSELSEHATDVSNDFNAIPSSPIFSNIDIDHEEEEEEEEQQQQPSKKQKLQYSPSNPNLSSFENSLSIASFSPSNFHKPITSAPPKVKLIINNGRAELYVPPPSIPSLPHYASPSLSPSPAISSNVTSWTADSDIESDFETESEFQKYGGIINRVSTSDAIAAFATTIARSSAKVSNRKSKGNKKYHNNHNSRNHNHSYNSSTPSIISPSSLHYSTPTLDNSLSFFLDSQKYQNTVKTGFTVPVRCLSPSSSPNLYDPELFSSDPSTPPGSVLLYDDTVLGTFGTGMTPYLPGR